MKKSLCVILVIIISVFTGYDAIAQNGGSFYNVKEQGIYGDGTHNDYPAIQNLLDRIGKEGGGTIYFPDGIYRLASHQELRVYSNTRVIGSGWNAILKQESQGHGLIKFGNIDLGDYGSFVTLFNIALIGDRSITDSLSTAPHAIHHGIGIEMSYLGTQMDSVHSDPDPTHWTGWGLTVDRTFIHSWPLNGIWSAPHTKIRNCKISDCRNEPFLAQGDYAEVCYNQIDSCNSWLLDANASYIQFNYNQLSYGNLPDTVDAGGITISNNYECKDGLQKIEIIGNVISHVKGQNINITGDKHALINVRHVIIADNMITYTTRLRKYGDIIRIDGVADFECRNNIVFGGPKEYGIATRNFSGYGIVSGNRIVGTHGGILHGGLLGNIAFLNNSFDGCVYPYVVEDGNRVGCTIPNP